jgi:excinuclease ABC subunit C
MNDEQDRAEFDSGAFLRSLTTGPGVYRMLDTQDRILYVGKARNLKRRVASYFQKTLGNSKTRALMDQTTRVEVTVTHTETEALILENTLIKEHRPRYNVLLRDDKGYPYLHISDHPFPRLGFYRGARREGGRFFGPYPNVSAVHATLNELQKLFRIRSCTDSFFRNRTRPCLQFQIDRCTAPCVNYIDEAAYARDVEHAAMFLEGRNQAVIDGMVERMEAAAGSLDFERAAELRDQVARLRQAQARQHVSGEGGDLDVLAMAGQGELYCVAVLFVRGGRILGSRSFFPRTAAGTDAGEVLEAFVPQYYIGRETPPEILTDRAVPGTDLLEKSLGEAATRRVRLRHRVRGERMRSTVTERLDP